MASDLPAQPSKTMTESAVAVPNGHPPDKSLNTHGIPNCVPTDQYTEPQNILQETKQARPKRRGPNYHQIHSKPLPLEAYPLPAFHPSNPLSLLRLAYIYLSHLIAPPTSHLQSRYKGYLSPETRSVHITDPAHIRALWEMGFFGKGTLSRSEPSWMEREKARLRAERTGGMTAEEVTKARREERRMFKLERARLERERIERQRAVEEGRVVPEDAEEGLGNAVGTEAEDAVRESQDVVDGGSLKHALDPTPGQTPDALATSPVIISNAIAGGITARTDHDASSITDELTGVEEPDPDILNQEHLQLTFEEAFFLHYGLGVLEIYADDDGFPIVQSWQLLERFDAIREHQCRVLPDSQFLLSYVVYHHFRSLGWVVRSGVKFGVDYLLYNRGPVFSHAEFAILILPAYSNTFWDTKEGLDTRRVKEQKHWWWLHCVNRVQSQVKKTLVLCYVDVPAALSAGDEGNVGQLLRRYKVREVVVRRWLANRSRD